jgi:hypothetical protein
VQRGEIRIAKPFTLVQNPIVVHVRQEIAGVERDRPGTLFGDVAQFFKLGGVEPKIRLGIPLECFRVDQQPRGMARRAR